MWAVKRDGAVKEVTGTENEAFGRLLRLQPMSTDWAIKHEGWSVSELTGDECYGCGRSDYLDGDDPALHHRHVEGWDFTVVALSCSEQCAALVEKTRSSDGVISFPEVPDSDRD